jgi:predicted DNA-binding protein with PD1-like motif
MPRYALHYFLALYPYERASDCYNERMVVKKLKDGRVLARLELGEELVKCITDIVREHKIEGAWMNGMGGATVAQIGYFHRQRKKYVFRHVKDVVELVSLSGNVSWVGEEPVLHLHAIVTDKRNKAYGGHLKRLEVGATCEILITPLGEELTREMDPTVGLPLLKL